jgi:hypothetical protein
MVQTPVGARCRACANLRKPVLYSVTPTLLLRALGAAAALAVGVGVAWGYLAPNAQNVFGLFIFFPAAGFGWLVAEVIGRAANRRRAPSLRGIAVAACVLAYVVHNIVAPIHTLVPRNDIVGYIFTGLAAVVAASYLR